MRFEGTYTALATPFQDMPEQAVDWDAFDRLIDAQVAGGISGLVPCGTTGESPTLTHEEHAKVVERAIARAARAETKVQVIAGAGSNSTHEAVALAQHAERAGADAVMIVVPYYNRPSQAGLAAHFIHVARSVKVPVVVYNVPARTGSDLAAETLARIAEAAPNVVAIKEATGNVLRAQKITQIMGPKMAILCGDDALTLPMIAVGARGVISVTSNVLPAEVSRATRLALDAADGRGSWEEARRAHLALLPVHEAMFLEANPSPVKAALAMRGIMREGVRGPLAPCSEPARKALAAVLETFASGGQGRL